MTYPGTARLAVVGNRAVFTVRRPAFLRPTLLTLLFQAYFDGETRIFSTDGTGPGTIALGGPAGFQPANYKAVDDSYLGKFEVINGVAYIYDHYTASIYSTDGICPSFFLFFSPPTVSSP